MLLVIRSRSGHPNAQELALPAKLDKSDSSKRLPINDSSYFNSAIRRWSRFASQFDVFVDSYEMRNLKANQLWDESLCMQLKNTRDTLSNLVSRCSHFDYPSPKRVDVLWKSSFDSFRGPIMDAAGSVDRKLATVELIMESQDIVRTATLISCLETFDSYVQALIMTLDKWFLVPLTEPDSARVNEILTKVTNIESDSLHFVDRVDSAKKLFMLQLQSYKSLRKFQANSGTCLIFPLMDSLSGMGKTTFGSNYLALIATMSTEILQSASHHSSESVKGLLADLRSARTLQVTFNPGSLLEPETRMTIFVEELVKRMENSWGVVFPSRPDNLRNLLNVTHKPVFFVLDEIGAAFASIANDPFLERQAFYEFAQYICSVLNRTEGVYYVLCGRAEFMWDVGVRRDEAFVLVSPGRFQRVNLNPIRGSKISELLEYTMCHGESLATKLTKEFPCQSLAEIVTALYVKTAGHPRSLLDRLKSKNPLSDDFDSSQLLNEVKLAVEKFPRAVHDMFARRHETVDLTSVMDPAGRRVTGEYVASRIHAGFGQDLEKTKIFIPPSVEEYLICHFLPIVEFAIAYENLLDKRHVSREDIFEEFIVKWFQSAFVTADDTIGKSLGDFCPRDSILYNRAWNLRSVRVKEGLRILSDKRPSSIAESTISVFDLAKKFRKYLTKGKEFIYFPAPLSASPDLFLMPPATDLEKILVGVQAKCYSNKEHRISKSLILDEVRKFYHILSAVRKDYPSSIGGVLIMLSTSMYTECDFGPLHDGAKGFVWRNPTAKEMGIEVLIINLSSADLRKEFVGVAVEPAYRDRVAGILERIIQYTSRQPCLDLQDASPSASSSSD